MNQRLIAVTRKQTSLVLILCLSFWAVPVTDVLGQTPSIQWQKPLGGTDTDVPQCIYQTKDGGYIIGGAAGSKDGDVVGQHGNGDMWVVKLSASGTIEWKKAFGGGSEDKGTLVQQTLDGGYIVGGNTSSSNGDVKGNHGGGDIWILKLSATGSIVWQRSLGGSSLDELKALQEVTIIDPASGLPLSKGFIVGGNTLSNNGDVSGNHGKRDVWIVKLAPNGDKQWQRALGSSGEETINHLEPTSDAGCIIGSRVSTNGGDVSGIKGGVDLWVVKLDTDGQIEWNRTLGGSGSETFTAVRQTKDGGYIVGTHCNSNDGDVSGSTTTSLWVVKLKASGEVEWQKKLDDYGYSEYRDMRETADEGFIVCGATYPMQGNANALLVRLTAAGTVVWAKEYGYGGNDDPYRIQETTDKGYIITGATNSPEVNGFHAGPIDQWLLKLDENGNKTWERAFGGSNEDWYWGGCCGGATLGSTSSALMMPSSLTPYMKLQSNEGGYFFAISTKSRDGDVSGLHYNARLGIRSDIWVVKLGPDGLPVVQSAAPPAKENSREAFIGTKAFPNPFNRTTTIQFTAAESGKTTIDIFNADGKRVKTIFNEKVAEGRIYTVRIQDGMLPKGIYFYSINNSKRRFAGQLIKN